MIIQSRNGSRRFPNKAIVDLCGSPLLERIIQRVKKSKMVDQIIDNDRGVRPWDEG